MFDFEILDYHKRFNHFSDRISTFYSLFVYVHCYHNIFSNEIFITYNLRHLHIPLSDIS